MSNVMPKGVMALFSIVERTKGTRLIQKLRKNNVGINFQLLGMGTAPTEMMDIFGIGSREKDVIISFGAEKVIRSMMSDFGNSFSSHSEYGGLMIVLKPAAINRLVSEVLNHNITADEEAGRGDALTMKNGHKHFLIFISVGQGYTDQVMQVARKAGAAGGTVLRGRVADAQSLNELAQVDIQDERGILCIMAPAAVSQKIMEDVNREFGLRSPAHGIICAVPVEKAYKI